MIRSLRGSRYSQSLAGLLPDPFVLLAVPAALPAEEEPLWFVVAFPPSAVLEAGASTTVLPPLL